MTINKINKKQKAPRWVLMRITGYVLVYQTNKKHNRASQRSYANPNSLNKSQLTNETKLSNSVIYSRLFEVSRCM